MQKFAQEYKNLLNFAKGSKFLLAGFAVFSMAAFLSWNVFLSQPESAAAAQDCDKNAIIECGFLAGSRDSAVTGFTQDYSANKTGDLEQVYAKYGLVKSEVARFKKDAKLGYVTKDGDVVVDGKVVGENARSVGRQNMSGSEKKTIDGKTYYERSTKTAFDTDKIPALVLMNGDKVEFVVLSSCGNPVTSTPPKKTTPPQEKETPSTFTCDSLTVTKKSRTQFEFRAKGTAGKDYTITGYRYNIYSEKDSFIAQIDLGGDRVASYTRDQEGSYTVKAFVSAKEEGKDSTSFSKETASCTKSFEVTKKDTPAIAECTKLEAKLRDGTRDTYDYTVTTRVEGDAKIINYIYDFGEESFAPETKTEATASHTFKKEGEHISKVTVVFEVNGTRVQKTSSACAVSTPVKHQDFCKPGIPVGDTRCSETPAPTTPPPSLPATGMETALAGVFGTSALGGATYYWRSSRRTLIGRILGR